MIIVNPQSIQKQAITLKSELAYNQVIKNVSKASKINSPIIIFKPRGWRDYVLLNQNNYQHFRLHTFGETFQKINQIRVQPLNIQNDQLGHKNIAVSEIKNQRSNAKHKSIEQVLNRNTISTLNARELILKVALYEQKSFKQSEIRLTQTLDYQAFLDLISSITSMMFPLISYYSFLKEIPIDSFNFENFKELALNRKVLEISVQENKSISDYAMIFSCGRVEDDAKTFNLDDILMNAVQFSQSKDQSMNFESNIHKNSNKDAQQNQKLEDKLQIIGDKNNDGFIISPSIFSFLDSMITQYNIQNLSMRVA